MVCCCASGRGVATGAVADVARRGLGVFDTFLMMGNNLGLLAGAEAAPRGLDAPAAAPGAVIVGQGMDPYGTGKPVHLAYHERNRAAGRMPGQIRMRIRHEDLATPWFDYLFTSEE